MLELQADLRAHAAWAEEEKRERGGSQLMKRVRTRNERVQKHHPHPHTVDLLQTPRQPFPFALFTGASPHVRRRSFSLSFFSNTGSGPALSLFIFDRKCRLTRHDALDHFGDAVDDLGQLPEFAHDHGRHVADAREHLHAVGELDDLVVDRVGVKVFLVHLGAFVRVREREKVQHKSEERVGSAQKWNKR